MSNSIEKLAKEAERLAENLQGNPFPVFDRIAKDIRERQDNTMAMEFTKCIGELLRKNGVMPKIKQYGCDFYGENSFQSKFGVIIDELDFSEHDKVFEDKIAELKKDYKTASELLGKYQQENESLKKRVVELENFSCQAEQETESLVEKLKQRIDELESKETEKPTKINLNDRIKVKLTPLGAEIYYHQYDDIHKDYPKMKKHLQSSLPKVDENGYTEFQLWHFMELYGEHIGMCKPNVINPLDIVVSE